MKIINNKEEWDKFKRNCSRSPSTFPCIAYSKHESFGIMGDGYATYFADIPDIYKNKPKLLDAYLDGFKDGVNK